MSAAAAASICVRICMAARPKVTGARAAERAITIANVVRKTDTPENVRLLRT